jgi:hypothetical protein
LLTEELDPIESLSPKPHMQAKKEEKKKKKARQMFISIFQ